MESGDVKGGEKYFSDMKDKGIKPDIVIYTTMAQLYYNHLSGKQSISKMNSLTEEARKNCRSLSPDFYQCLLDFAWRGLDLELAQEILDEIKGLNRLRMRYIVLRYAYSTCMKIGSSIRQPKRVLAYLQEAIEKGIHPTKTIYNTVLDSAVKTDNFKLAKRIWDTMKGTEKNEFAYTRFLVICGKKRKIKILKNVLAEMERNLAFVTFPTNTLKEMDEDIRFLIEKSSIQIALNDRKIKKKRKRKAEKEEGNHKKRKVAEGE